MGEVIDFQKYTKPKTMPNPVWLEFVDMMNRNGLCEDDIAEVTDAIADPKHYETAEPDIQRIADVWLNFG
jgi:alanine racemase